VRVWRLRGGSGACSLMLLVLWWKRAAAVCGRSDLERVPCLLQLLLLLLLLQQPFLPVGLSELRQAQLLLLLIMALQQSRAQGPGQMWRQGQGGWRAILCPCCSACLFIPDSGMMSIMYAAAGLGSPLGAARQECWRRGARGLWNNNC